jgi:hypothetical protein
MVVYHMLHGLTNATSEANGPVISCEGAVLARFEKWDNHSFSPGSWYQVTCPYMIVHGQQKLSACTWEVRQHLVMDTIWARDVLWQRSNTARRSSVINGALYALTICKEKLNSKVSASSFRT